jgi:hypothetical protein
MPSAKGGGTRAISSQEFGARHVFEGMVGERLHGFEEAHGMRQTCVKLERRFVCPARVNIEQAWVANGAKRMDAQAAGFLAGGS